MHSVPSDWPADGPIDLAVHDAPHRSADTEWWYVNTHFESAEGRAYSLFAAFFRIAAGVDEKTGERTHAHSVTWALTDAMGHTYFAESRVDEKAPEMGLQRIENGGGVKDPRLNRAMAEELRRGNVPRPDRVFDAPVHVDLRRLDLDFGGARFFKTDEGDYRLVLHNDRAHVGCELTFSPKKPPIRHGDNGVVRGKAGEDMFYYFMPRCEVTGTVTVDGHARPVRHGQGWYDHEFGGHARPEAEQGASDAPAEPEKAQAPAQEMAWNWCAIQLEDGRDLSGFEVVDMASGETVSRGLICVDKDGARTTLDDFVFTAADDTWRSTRTFQEYPMRYRLESAQTKLALDIKAVVQDQEFITTISHPAFWEGRCEIEGTIAGESVRGLGYIERSGFSVLHSLDEFFSAVGKRVMASVSEVLPLEPSYEALRELIASESRDQYMAGVDAKAMSDYLIAPIRAITDRGGKSWRSYAALACCDVVGGDSRDFVQWLAMPELMHVGSLIVDDVQDRSTVRRGGPACHALYGEPVAINAGTAAYFLTQNLLRTSKVSAQAKLDLYDLYFLAMRAGHAGQAIDHGGVYELMPEAIKTGESKALEDRILACYRLKTAVPAASLASMGAVAGGGTQAQIDAVGDFFESLGLAFQIIDDVLNLRGFKNDLKTRGEDIMNGLVTLPVARALPRLDVATRENLWATIQSKPQDPAVVAATVELLESCGAIEDCAQTARDLVEDCWTRVEPLFEPSIAKIMLRAFGWFVLERHY